MGRGDTRKTEVAEQWLEQTHQQLTMAAGLDLEQARAHIEHVPTLITNLAFSLPLMGMTVYKGH
jgi:hypothetical protein